jgi:hypothetical protein
VLSIDASRRLAGGRPTLAEALAMPGFADIDLDTTRPRDLPRDTDLKT